MNAPRRVHPLADGGSTPGADAVEGDEEDEGRKGREGSDAPDGERGDTPEPAADAPFAIETEGLSKFYGDVRGVEELTLRVPRGELFGLLGPNGAGKTTLIRLVLGLIRPTAGTARVLGAAIDDRDAFREVRRRVGYLPSDAVLYDELSGRRVLDYFAELTGDERRAELLALFPVPIDRPVREYSRGNRQKLAIVQAFMHDPDLVVMDEPTSGLDPLVQATFADFLRRERDRGTTVVFSTHVLGEVRGLCDRVAIVRAGRLVAVEDIDTLLARSGKVVRVVTDEPVDPDAFAFEGVIDAAVEDGTLRLVVSGNYDALVDALSAYHVRDLDVSETAVEDVFMHFYEDAPGADDGDGTGEGDEGGENGDGSDDDSGGGGGSDGENDRGGDRDGRRRSPLAAVRRLLDRVGGDRRAGSDGRSGPRGRRESGESDGRSSPDGRREPGESDAGTATRTTASTGTTPSPAPEVTDR